MSSPRPVSGGQSVPRPGSSIGQRHFGSTSSSTFLQNESYTDILQREEENDPLMRILNHDKNLEITKVLCDAEAGRLKSLLKSHEKYGDIYHCKGHDGNTALHMACRNGKIPVVKELLRNGVSVNEQTTNSGETPLHLAVYADKTHTAKLLLKQHSIDLNLVNHDVETSLFYAARKGNAELIELLLLSGVDYTIEDRYGELAFDHCSNQACIDAFDVIAKGNVNVKRKSSWSKKSNTTCKVSLLDQAQLMHIHSYLRESDRLVWVSVNKQWRAVTAAYHKSQGDAGCTVSAHSSSHSYSPRQLTDGIAGMNLTTQHASTNNDHRTSVDSSASVNGSSNGSSSSSSSVFRRFADARKYESNLSNALGAQSP